MSSHAVALAGVAHLRSNREREPRAGREPLTLMIDAARAAARDAGRPEILTELDGISIVQQLTWTYDDLAGQVVRELGCPAARTEVGRVGGDTPLTLLAAAADRISRGESQAELVVAAEALSTLREALTRGIDPGWTTDPGGPFAVPDDWRGPRRMRQLDLDWPIRVYPLFENALRARLGQSFAEAQVWTGRIYADFAEVATRVDAAWNPEPLKADEVIAVGPGNRMVCWPYPMRVNSFLMVDQAAAVLLLPADGAPGAVHLLGTVAGTDSADVLERESLAESAVLAGVLQGVLTDTGTATADLTALDLYSCFPVVPKLGALALGLAPGRALTTTGGMNAFGGAGNGYSLHAVVTTVQTLRAQAGQGAQRGRGLVHANGEYLTKQAAAVFGTTPAPPTTRELGAPPPGPAVSDGPQPGAPEPVTVETYTVEFGRDGTPARGWVIGRTGTGARSAGRVVDPAVLRELTDPEREPIGCPGTLRAAGDGPGMFSFKAGRS